MKILINLRAFATRLENFIVARYAECFRMHNGVNGRAVVM